MSILNGRISKDIVNKEQLFNVYAMVLHGTNLFFADGTDYPNQTNKIYVYDTNLGRVYHTIKCTFPVTSLGITADGNTLVACGYDNADTVFTYNMPTRVGYTFIRKGIKKLKKCQGNIYVVSPTLFYVANGENKNIAKVTISGPNFSVFDFTTAGTITIPMGIAFDGTHLYCNDYADNTIYRATLDGSIAPFKIFPQGNKPNRATDIIFYLGCIVIADKDGIKAYNISGNNLTTNSAKLDLGSKPYALTTSLYYSRYNRLPYVNKFDIISQLFSNIT